MTVVPGPAVETIPAVWVELDERFAGIRGDERLERLWTGGRWLEGPVYSPAGRYLLFSDIPNDRILRWDETSDAVSVFRQPAGNANGHTLDRQGRLVSCEHGNRRVTRTEHDGAITVLARPVRRQAVEQPERRGGAPRRLDLVHRPGVRDRLSDYEGYKGEIEIGRLPRLPDRPGDGALTRRRRRLQPAERAGLLARRVAICTSPTPGEAHPACSTSTAASSPAARSSPPCDAGIFDGLRLDTAGRVWAAAARRRALLRPRRHPDRQAAGTRDRLQPLLRRREAQPPLHHRDHARSTPLTTVNGAPQPYDPPASPGTTPPYFLGRPALSSAIRVVNHANESPRYHGANPPPVWLATRIARGLLPVRHSDGLFSPLYPRCGGAPRVVHGPALAQPAGSEGVLGQRAS